MRYEFKVTKQGTRMDDAPLFGLTVIDKTPALPFLAKCQYDELTEYELAYYLDAFKKEANAQ